MVTVYSVVYFQAIFEQVIRSLNFFKILKSYANPVASQ